MLTDSQLTRFFKDKTDLTFSDFNYHRSGDYHAITNTTGKTVFAGHYADFMCKMTVKPDSPEKGRVHEELERAYSAERLQDRLTSKLPVNEPARKLAVVRGKI
ncbi:hypothetical protein PMO31116_00504 [Pandoraea morbifera]|uniref:Uncharacterized protein n=1 Tax=Pandoraea morbifera TaxID=2508300 RepID=A0A5E4S114_9BURK|nr:hypothetical protein [Pandoraea morbifera]VVD69085.1 hypothetical protein PMO31116_00504 [Pandoraea morbifera]